MTEKELYDMLALIAELGSRFATTPAEVELQELFFPTEEVDLPEGFKDLAWLK